MTCPLEEAGVRPAFTMYHPEEQLGAFLCDVTRLQDNLEVHLHDTPTRRGVRPAFTMHHPEKQPGAVLCEGKLEVHLHDMPTRRGVRPAFTMHHPEEQPGVFLRDVMRLEDNWRCTFVAHPLEEAGGWSEAIARKALLC